METLLSAKDISLRSNKTKEKLIELIATELIDPVNTSFHSKTSQVIITSCIMHSLTMESKLQDMI